LNKIVSEDFIFESFTKQSKKQFKNSKIQLLKLNLK